ncbi:MAG: YbhB/YbcL family Raf kinase inhibitor-like protein [Steroidobacteraceae bacterium]
MTPFIRLRTALIGSLGATLALGGLAVHAQTGGAVTPTLAITLAPARAGMHLRVRSRAFRNGHTLPRRFTSFGSSKSPPLRWTRGPAGTRSYVVLVEDAGVARREPIVHWVLYNVPSDVRRLRANVSKVPEPQRPAGARNGLNIMRKPGYIGPRPPKGQTHPYHFEVFALDEKLSLSPPEATRNAVVDAMQGHVLASGEIVAHVTGE